MFEDSHFVSLNACNTHPLIHTIWLVHSKAGCQSLKISTLTQYMKHIWSIISRVSAECSRSKPPDMEDDTMVVFGGSATFCGLFAIYLFIRGTISCFRPSSFTASWSLHLWAILPILFTDEQKISHINLCCQSI